MTTVAPHELRVTSYTPDEISGGATWARIISYGLIGGVLAFVAWFLLHTTTLPAFNTSMVTRALSVSLSLLIIALALIAAWLWISARRRNWFVEAVLSLAPAGIVVSSLGIPLSATKLWLDGIQVDQGFRTQFLTRMTESISYADMNYVDLPTFYPMGWFFLGGRMANLLGMPGWEVYQPWALTSLAAGAAMLTPVWRRLTGSLPTAAAIAMVTTAVVLTEVPDEPYAALVAMFVPAATIGAQRALSGSWFATIALALFLGVSATFYTLFTAITALTVVVLAVILFLNDRGFTPIKHLLIIGFSSLAIALVAWGPYLYNLLFGDFQARSTANHFLPPEGTYFPLPFFSISIIGLLSLIGLIWLVIRMNEPEIAALSLAILVCYLWAMASMAVTLVGTSLLGFRVEVLLILIFATAGVLGIAEIMLVGFDFLYPDRFSDEANRGVLAAVVILIAAGSLFYVQQIPEENESHIDQAYADTDGYGERADKFPPDAARYYGDIVEYLKTNGRNPGEAVIYTDEINFMAYNSYYGFNAFTSHYANPLGEFDMRNEDLAAWAELSNTNPREVTAAIDASAWRPPEAFIFRGDLAAGTPLKTHIAHDIYPSQPNVRYEGLFFNPAAFPAGEWSQAQIGPFVVVVRN